MIIIKTEKSCHNYIMNHTYATSQAIIWVQLGINQHSYMNMYRESNNYYTIISIIDDNVIYV